MEKDTTLENWLISKNLTETVVLEKLQSQHITLDILLYTDEQEIRALCDELEFSAAVKIKLVAALKDIANSQDNEEDEEEEEEEEDEGEEQQVEQKEIKTKIEQTGYTNAADNQKCNEDDELALKLQIQEIANNEKLINQNSFKVEETQSQFDMAEIHQSEFNMVNFQNSFDMTDIQSLLATSNVKQLFGLEEAEKPCEEKTITVPEKTATQIANILDEAQFENPEPHVYEKCSLCTEPLKIDDLSSTFGACQCRTHSDCYREWIAICKKNNATLTCPTHPFDYL